MATDARLTKGGRIDRARPIRFRFNGKSYEGLAGDTLASALLANGVSVTARSFKYHRPRGIVGHGVEEPSTLVELDGDNACGNIPATTVSLRDGLQARSVNCWPSAEYDFGAISQLIARFIPAGFYYKTFKWPGWHLFEPAIRRAAGLAAAPAAPPASGHFEARHAHADVLIAGAGPAGLMAALVAARSGARVFIADEGTEAGGNLLNARYSIAGMPALEWVAQVVAELKDRPNVTHLQNTTIWAYREHNLLIANQRNPDHPGLLERSWRIRAAQVICATGAIERMLVFANNDLPGVMLAASAQAYVNRYAVRPGKRAVIFTNNNSAYSAARELADAGLIIAAIVDSRAAVPAEARAMAKGIELLQGHVITEAKGYKRVKAAVIKPFDGGPSRLIACDLIAHSGGWNPTVHLFSQSRGDLRFDDRLAAFVPDKPAQHTWCAGAADGVMLLADALKSGATAGSDAAQAAGYKVGDFSAPLPGPHFLWVHLRAGYRVL